MASTLCNVILTAIIFASTQSWSLGLSPEEYSTRSPLGKIIDGLDIQQQLLLSELKKNNLDQEVRDVVKSLIQLQVFHEDQPYDESLGLIMAAILKDSCVWVSELLVALDPYLYILTVERSPSNLNSSIEDTLY